MTVAKTIKSRGTMMTSDTTSARCRSDSRYLSKSDPIATLPVPSTCR